MSQMSRKPEESRWEKKHWDKSDWNTRRMQNWKYWQKMMHESEVSDTFQNKEFSMRCCLNMRELEMRIVSESIRHKWCLTFTTWLYALNSVLWKQLLFTQRRKTERILFYSTHEVSRKENHTLSSQSSRTLR